MIKNVKKRNLLIIFREIVNKNLFEMIVLIISLGKFLTLYGEIPQYFFI